MSDNKIIIVIETTPDEDYRVRLSDLANELQALHDILGRMDKLIGRSASPSMYFRVENVKYSSPLTIEVAPIALRTSSDHTLAVTNRFISDLESIKNGHDPVDLDLKTLESFRDIAKRVRKSVQEIRFSLNGKTVSLEDNLSAPIEKILGKVEYESGTASGILELLSIHGGAHKFNIYPNVGANKIECFFSSGLLEKAKGAIGHKVDVTGRLHYKSRRPFPHAIEIREFEIVPDDSVLPTADDLFGIAPNATGNLSSEEYVAELRRGK